LDTNAVSFLLVRKALIFGAKVIPVHAELAHCFDDVEIIYFHTSGYYTMALHLISNLVEPVSLELRAGPDVFMSLPLVVNRTSLWPYPNLKTTWKHYYMYAGMSVHLVRKSQGPNCMTRHAKALVTQVEGFSLVKYRTKFYS